MGDGCSYNTADGIEQKSVILEKTEDEHVDDDRKDQISAPGFFGAFVKIKPHIIVEDRGEEHQDDIDGFSPGIKKQASDKKDNVLALSGNQIINQHENRQKTEYKEDTAEYHENHSTREI